MRHDVLTRIMNVIGMLFIIMLFAPSIEAVEELKVSQLNGGIQYWWEVEEFDERDEPVFAQAAPLPVQPKNKLATVWARMKIGKLQD